MAYLPPTTIWAKAAQFILKFGWPKIQLERRRRDADEGYPHDFRLFDPILVEALDLLARGKANPIRSPWRWIRYVASDPPHSLTSPGAREWLSLSQVQEAAKEAIRARFVHSSPTQSQQVLLDSWANHSGESTATARGIVHDLLAFLALSVNRHLTFADQITIEHQNLLIETVSKVVQTEVRETFSRQSKEVAGLADREATIWIDREVERQLSASLKRRFLPGWDFLGDVSALADAIMAGGLRGASPRLISQVLVWQARAYAARKKADAARSCLNAAMSRDARANFAAAEARVLFAEGEEQKAYALLRDRLDSEERSTLLVLLTQREGAAAAEQYINSHPAILKDRAEASIIICVQTLSAVGRWDDVWSLLDDLSVDCIKTSAVLSAQAGLYFLARAAPQEQRLGVLQGIPLDPKIVRFKDSAECRAWLSVARQHLLRASSIARDLGASVASDLYEDLALWAWFANTATVEDARRQLALEIRGADRAARFVRFAIAYNVSFDLVALQQHLESRRRLGGWSELEIEAALLVALKENEPAKVREFIETHKGELVKRFDPSLIISLEIQTLAQSGQRVQAGQLLEDSRAVLGEEVSIRLSAFLQATPEDIDRLRVLYERTKAIEDLDALIGALGRRRDWKALLPLAREMYSKTLQVGDAIVVSEALAAIQDEDELFAFLDSIQATIPKSNRLKQLYAWALFHEGRLSDADRILASIPVRDRQSDDRNLYVTISIESGEWERLTQFVESEWENRETRNASDLLRAATIAREVESGRVGAFLAAAVDLEPDNPNILIGAYSIAVETGQEDSVARADWLSRAIGLAKPGGPVKAVTMKELADMQSGWRKQVEFVGGALATGMPLFIAAQGLRTSLTRLMFLSLFRNSRELDPRRRSFVPAYHPASTLRGVSDLKVIVLDVTALFIMHYLGLLERVVNSFERIILPAGTLSQIFQERKGLRFHQPSRLKEGAGIRRAVEGHRLAVCTSLAGPDIGLEREAGTEFAKLVATASRDGGVVVRPLPVSKIGSLGEEHANVEAWKDHIFDMHELISGLRARSAISEEEQIHALAFLSTRDQRWHETARDIPDGPLFLDGLTVTYLWTIGLFDRVCETWGSVSISEETFEHFTNLDQVVANSEGALDGVETLRKLLHKHLASGSICLARRRRVSSKHDEFRDFPTVTLLAELPVADAVVVDDRGMNQHGTITDEKGRTVPVVTSLNILDDLRKRGLLAESEWRGARHKLRLGGVGLFPFDPSELDHYLKGSLISKGRLVETQELRAVRESLAILSITQPLDPQTEAVFLAMMLTTIRQSIATVWKGDEADSSLGAKADWLYELLNRPADLIRADLAQAARVGVSAALSGHAALLCIAFDIPNVRKEAYGRWMDSLLKKEARGAERNFKVEIVKKLKELIERVVQNAS